MKMVIQMVFWVALCLIAAWVLIGIIGLADGDGSLCTESFRDAVESLVPHRIIDGHECAYVHGRWLVVVRD